MHLLSRRSFVLVLTVAVFVATGCNRIGPDPFHVYLVLGEEGSTEMGVHWHTMAQAGASRVHYDTVSHGGAIDAYAHEAEAERRNIEGLPDGRQIHGALLTELEPGTVYYFVAGDPQTGYSREKSFRTPPGPGEPMRFVIGGDIGVRRAASRLTRLAAQYDPAFVVIGGDIAYANGDLQRVDIWDRWFKIWTSNMVTSEGHMIPFVAGIGNHETNRESMDTPERRAPYYLNFFFTQVEQSYFVCRVSDYLAFIMLDSSHLVWHYDQLDFLREELERHAEFPAVFPVYHVPFYPAHRPFDYGASNAGRDYWKPIFEEYGVRVAFENHDHVAKRTHPLKGGEIHPDGIVYIGDGAFGVRTRSVEPRWYLDMVESKQHFWVAELTPARIELTAIDIRGRAFDKVTLPLRALAEAGAGVAAE
jgi:hypothetical protein